jgi:hypothetical protein
MQGEQVGHFVCVRFEPRVDAVCVRFEQRRCGVRTGCQQGELYERAVQ